TSSHSVLLDRRPRPTLVPYTTLFRSGCDKIKLAIDKIKGQKPSTTTAARPGVPAADTTKRPVTATAPVPGRPAAGQPSARPIREDRKSTRLNSSHEWISYAVFCLKVQ